jgi:hypothetical protein
MILDDKDDLSPIIEKFHKSKKLIFITGAGISVSGGIPVIFFLMFGFSISKRTV